MIKDNSYYVQLNRKNGTNDKQNKIYRKLRNKFGIKSRLACKMKYWSADRILEYIDHNNIKVLDTYVEEVVDRL